LKRRSMEGIVSWGFEVFGNPVRHRIPVWGKLAEF
jgi:hypothetical protein